MEQYDAMYVAGTPWPVLGGETAASHSDWTMSPEFKEGIANLVEAVAEGRRAAAEIEKTLTG
jgi:hypothetical protein